MSFGIIRVQKMKAGHVKGMQIHDQREKDVSHSNQDIDFSKSHLNIDLKNTDNINFTKTVNERIKSLKLPKAVRKDAVVMCQCLITSDNEFFSNMEESKQKEFFNNAYEFIKKRYGEENIISATIHYDETTPHLHVNFVPVTSDGRLSAKDLFKKSDLFKLHDDFYKFNLEHGYNLERGETKEEKRKHLSAEQYKIKTGFENIKESQEELQKLKDEICKLKDELNKALKDFKDINITDGKKNILTGKINMQQKDFDTLKLLAQRGVLSIDENSILIKKCEVAEEMLGNKTLELDKVNKVLAEKEKLLNKTREELNSANRVKSNMSAKLRDYDKVFDNVPQVKEIALNLLNFLNREEFRPSKNIERWLGVPKEGQEKILSDIEDLKEMGWEQDM